MSTTKNISNDNNNKFRIEHDSMGELKVPESALYGAQTQRACENFPISHHKMPKEFIKAMGLIKASAAEANNQLDLLDNEKTNAIVKSAQELIEGLHYEQFPIDVFQTGSGTSTNMNTNEVISHLAKKYTKETVHPNDHVNMSQSSNDVIPTAIHVSASILVYTKLKPALEKLYIALKQKAETCKDIVKTGRTHLMDAMPVTLEQELNCWAQQIFYSKQRIDNILPRLNLLAQGGTAVGTGINAHPKFGEIFAKKISNRTNINFTTSPCYFVELSSQDTILELSGHLKTLAASLMKISNDLRWMNSGPLTGLSEITLKPLQPGSSIMPGKINPVIPEAVCMVAAQIIGHDAAITVGAQSGNFQLNVMLPVIALNIINSLEISANACEVLADKAIKDFIVNETNLDKNLSYNPILVTALNPIIGYEIGAKVAKTAYAEKISVKEAAKKLTTLSDNELDKILDPLALTKGGIFG